MNPLDLQSLLDGLWRTESARLVATLTRLLRDVGRAEQLAQDAFVSALEQWPRDGVPGQPGAWLLATARRRAIDALRRDSIVRWQPVDAIGEPVAGGEDPAAVAANEVRDDVLRLVFLCCHPVLPQEARTALTLRLLGGLPSAAIARAYLVPEATIAQRIVRAKRTLADLQIELELPGATERRQRLDAVLEVIYLVFNEGYTRTSGEGWLQPELCHEGLRLARVLAELMPHDAEVHGLAALLELQGSRLAARCTATGEPVLLPDQDRTRWDRLLIHRGEQALLRAQGCGGDPGTYQLQAAIAACHARAAMASDTDWPRIVRLYGELARTAPSPIVELNRAVAVAMAFGPAAGLYLLEPLRADPALAGYHLLPSVRGDLLARLGHYAEAQVEFARAAALTGNERERCLLLRRAALLGVADR